MMADRRGEAAETGHLDHRGFRLRWLAAGPEHGEPVLLVHGFASNIETNWVNPGWVQTLSSQGRRVLAFDHRGHGQSSRSRNAEDFAPLEMAADATALLDHFGIGKAHWFGYSMGGRVAAFAAVAMPQRVASLCLGGIGDALVKGSGFWGPVREALLTDDPATITDPKAMMFRKFADQTGSDRIALAACIEGSRANLPEDAVRRITAPTLIAVGTRDDVAGDPHRLAALLPRAEVLSIEGRDHMLSVGDRQFKAAYPAFLARAGHAP
ncbi:MAG: alpha/beta fold hydrolase [Rhizobiaceae bacterium]|jgi:pimeloyl-ACP methyl ester carboxylesterase|nr:alpha/beta fold hydrolase [Rhizobiaceae bacterium]